MNEPEPYPPARREPPPPGPGGELVMSLISAGLFLYVGFVLGYEGFSKSALYNGSVAALTWGARIVGIGLLVTAALAYFRIPAAEPIDLVLTALATVLCFGVGLIWLVFSDMEGVLLLLFGLLNGSATISVWRRWQARRAWQAANVSDEARFER